MLLPKTRKNKKAITMLSMIILDVVAIIAILSLVLLGDFFESQRTVEVNNAGKEVVCRYGVCYFIDANVINQPYVQYPYGPQGAARTGP